MKAIAFATYGSADALTMMDLPVPALSPSTVRVRIAAAGINPADWRIRSGQFRFARLRMPFVPGSDIAGVVDALGEGTTQFKVGDRVYGMTAVFEAGGYAEFATVAANALAPAPRNLSLAQAAAVPLAGLTAHQALLSEANLQSGQRLLIYGASGGVGTFAIQIAKAIGAHVTAACSTRNIEFVHGLGADTVLDYTRDNLFSARDPYHVIFDAVAKVNFTRWRNVLEPDGTVVSLNPVIGNIPGIVVRMFGINRLRSFLVKPDGARLAQLTTMIEAGNVKPVIDRVFPLADVAEAHRYSETERARGKLVLTRENTLVDADLRMVSGQRGVV